MAKKAMLKVVVDRKRWYRGQGDLDSSLLGNNRKMCCIGFLARSLGCKPKNIRNVPVLEYVRESCVTQFNTDYESQLMKAYEINDNEDIKDTIREQKLTTIGKRMGVQFQFIN